MNRVSVNLGKRTYKVIVGDNLVAKIFRYLPRLNSKTAFVISDRRLTSVRGLLKRSLKNSGWNVHEISVKAGESIKDFTQLFPLYGKILRLGGKRDSVIFALGGGSVGDAAGFLASTYMRGVPWVGIPTTLLAQVDSSIGGKTAVNHSLGKNLIGTFFQPSAVICDVKILLSLSQRELISGLGEAIKYGLVFDRTFCRYVQKNWAKALNKDPKVLTKIVSQSARWKAKIVAKDEYDEKGQREFLNFGHTFGHALESVTRYQKFQHGEAVIWGMRFALGLSEAVGLMNPGERKEIDRFLRGISVPALPLGARERLIAAFFHDKKTKGGRLRFVLLRGLGRPVSFSKVSRQDLLRAYELMTQGGSK